MSMSESHEDPPPPPKITALVATRNRGASVALTVKTLLANDHPDFAVLVVDQSTNDDTEDSIQGHLDDPRFTYLRTDTVGKGRAINLGCSLIESPYVAFTDDDCEIPSDWMQIMSDILDAHPKVCILFTNVVAAEHDSSAGFVPDYVRTDDVHVTSITGKLRARGIGAGMAARREA
ncbi:MAG: glycosyltransferase family A protein, partial [Actinomycetota bacterium]